MSKVLWFTSNAVFVLCVIAYLFAKNSLREKDASKYQRNVRLLKCFKWGWIIALAVMIVSVAFYLRDHS